MHRNTLKALALTLLIAAAVTPVVAKPNKSPKTVVVLGSSTAFGYGVPADSSWVGRLKTALPNTKVVNLAIGGYTSYHIMPNDFKTPANRPKTDTLHNVSKAIQHRPEVVIISMTNNDIANQYSIKDEYVGNLVQLVRYLKRNGVKQVYVTTTFPREKLSTDSLRLSRDLIVKQFKGHAINIYDTLCDKSTQRVYQQLQLGDGVHLNSAGQHAIFLQIWKKLQR